MNYAKIMENGTVRISSIKKEGYKPLKEEKPDGFSNLVFVGYTETEEFVIKEDEAVDDGNQRLTVKAAKGLKSNSDGTGSHRPSGAGTDSRNNENGGVSYGTVFSQ